MENWRNERDTGKPRYWDRNLQQVPLCSPIPKQTGMGSNPSLCVGLRKSRGIPHMGFSIYTSPLLGSDFISFGPMKVRGHTVAQSVEVLRYKPEDRGFDS